jgi:hypothetical protein
MMPVFFMAEKAQFEIITFTAVESSLCWPFAIVARVNELDNVSIIVVKLYQHIRGYGIKVENLQLFVRIPDILNDNILYVTLVCWISLNNLLWCQS